MNQNNLFMKIWCCYVRLTSLLAVFAPGGASRLSVRDPGLLVRGVVPELADPGPAVAGLHQAAVRGALPLCLWAVALDRQLRPHMRFHLRLLPVFRLPAVHQLRPNGPVPQTLTDHHVPAGVRRALLRPRGALLRLPNQVRLVRVAHLHPLHGQILREVRPQRSPPLKRGRYERNGRTSGVKTWTDISAEGLSSSVNYD